MRSLINLWSEAGHYRAMSVCWLATVFFSFWSSYLFSVAVPGIGELFPFRILLPVTALLYLLWAIRGNDRFWKDSSALEKWTYVFIAVMVLYGALSLPRALDFMHTFRKLFNLCFDMCYFFLALRLCKDTRLLKKTLLVCGVVALILALMGVYEIFFGGIFNTMYDGRTYFFLFDTYFQFPITVFCCCNGFTVTLLFTAAAIFLWWGARAQAPGKLQLWMAALGLPLLWFLLIASSSRLCMMSFVVMFAGVTVWLGLRGRKFLKYSALALGLILCVQFAHEYSNIVPPVRQYIAQMQSYREELKALEEAQNQPQTPGTAPQNPADTPAAPRPVPEKPTIHFGASKDGVSMDDFVSVDEASGETVLNTEASGGIRMTLLLHALDCLKESRGLGVGLGNTETLAARREVIAHWAEAGFTQYSIHCFLARMIADYGIFALIPLCAIAFLLLKRGAALCLDGLRRRDRRTIGQSVLFLCILVLFPVTSTADGDTQDLLSMWMYLAMLVLFAEQTKPRRDAALGAQPPKEPSLIGE